jgi:hypothetical protein
MDLSPAECLKCNSDVTQNIPPTSLRFWLGIEPGILELERWHHDLERLL